MISKQLNNKKLSWVLLSMMVAFIVAVVFQIASQSSYNPQIEKTLFENKLHNKIATLLQTLDAIKLEKESGRYNSQFSDFTLLSRFSNKSDNSFGFVITTQNRAKAWSSDAQSFFNTKDPLRSGEVQFLGNGWYYVVSKQVGLQNIWGLFCIKHEYLYQNRYLTNFFSDEFNLSPNAEISTKPSLFSFPIKDVQGNYLFSLKIKGHTKVSETFSLLSNVSFYLFLLLSVITLLLLIKEFLRSKQRHLYFFIEVVGVLLFYFTFTYFKYPQSFFEQEIFTASYFAASELLPSLGSFTLFAVYVFVLGYTFSELQHDVRYRYPQLGRFAKEITYLLSVLIAFILFILLYYLVNILVVNSSDLSVFFKVTDYNLVTLTKIFALVLLIMGYHLTVARLLRSSALPLSFSVRVVLLVAFIAVLPLFNWIFGFSLHWSLPLFFLLLIISIHTIPIVKRPILQYLLFIWFIALYAFFISSELLLLNVHKESVDRRLLLENIAITLTNEIDPAAEMELTKIGRSIVADKRIQELVRSSVSLETDLPTYVIRNYFVPGWDRYDIQVVGCFDYTNLKLDNARRTNCYSYFQETMLNKGTLISGSNIFYSIDNKNGKTTYLGVVNLAYDSESEFSLFIVLESRIFSEGVGYPELLRSDSEIQLSKYQDNYSYAKYVNKALVKRVGSVFYPIEGDLFDGPFGVIHEVEDEQASHLVLHPKEDTIIVLSRSKADVKKVLLAFSLIFTILFFAAGAIVIIQRYNEHGRLLWLSIQQRIQIAFVALVLFLTFSVILGSVSLSIYRFKEKNDELLFQKMRSLVIELESYYADKSSLYDLDEDDLNNQLIWLSNVFHCDMNIYDINGELFATSRSLLYDKQLVGRQMDSKAYVQLILQKKREFNQDEYVSRLRFTSAYTPLYNRFNEQIAFINIPYFTGEKELQEEVTSLLVTIINSAMFFLVLVLGVAMVVANKITAPMTLIQDGLEQIRLGHENRRIQYKADDELGKLIEVYNQMVDKLELSAEQLAKTEREGAWREMAKQIAHEIKNPLTPMKLSVQQLLRAWNDKKENFDTYIQKVSATLIEQIDNLSTIASEFSHFAKMPEGKFEEINLAVKLSNLKLLFEKSEEVMITVDVDPNATVTAWADNDQLTTVFNNLIKNGIQSTMGKRKSIIKIELSNEGAYIVVSIIDNGFGIPASIQDRLFEPSFTTKTSGMGLGLSICKKIIDSSNGSISFVTKVGEGSIFSVRLPIKK